MRVLTNELSISAPVDEVFKWFINLDLNYFIWHPKAHEKFKWLSDKPIKKGSRFYFIELVCGHRHQIFIEITEYIKNSKLSFQSNKIKICSNNIFDKLLSILATILQIKIEMKRDFQQATDNLTILHTTHKFGCNLPIIKLVADWVIGKFIFPAEEHEKHMREENENLKHCLESSNIRKNVL